MLSVVLALILLVASYYLYFWIIRPLSLIVFYRKQGISIALNPITNREVEDFENVEKHGDVFYYYKELIKKNPTTRVIGYHFGTSVHLIILDPNMLKDLFQNHDKLVKRESGDVFNGIVDNGLLFSKGENWKKQRKIVSAAFHYDFLKDNVHNIVNIVQELLQRLQTKDLNNIDFLQEVQTITGDVVGRLFLGESFSECAIEGTPLTVYLFDLLNNMAGIRYDPRVKLLGRGLIELGIFESHRRLKREVTTFRDYVKKLILKRMDSYKDKVSKGETNKERKNLAEMLFEQSLNSPDQFTIEDIMQQFNTFLFAGMDTTAHLVLMMSYYYLTEPSVREKISKEVEMLFRDPSKITLDTLNQMDYMTAFIKETMRVATPVPQPFERALAKNVEYVTLGNLKIKRGTILVPTYITNNFNELYHDDPYKFDLERWLKPSKTQESIKENPFVYTPFGGGPRNCIGQHLAYIQAKIIMGLFIKKFGYELSDKDYKLKMTLRLNYEPEDKLVYKLKPKST